MGLPMNNLHAPTVASGPTSGVAAGNGTEKDKLSLPQLIAEKDRVESELKALSGVLDSHGVNMNTSLTTFDGYPRDDLDIAQIRTTRSRIIYLRNDYKELMSRIEQGLHEYHASFTEEERRAPTRSEPPSNASPSTANAMSSASEVVDIPFAKVNSVVPGSPAQEAGLVAGDGIRRFGSVNWTNHEKLRRVADTVQENEGQPIMVLVQRKNLLSNLEEDLVLQLVPRRDWGGRGMLGCHLLSA
ncbi:MAG: hypothetical protein M4579_002310 [Chaenotheca gracillima]|nr:MAG: hypothetical protein M4579_002310 [Chaenotheca gracillima]